MTKRKEFYDKVAEILNVPHDYSTLNDVLFKRDRETGQLCGTNANRFGGREPGNGRFHRVGLIRHYGAVIHVSLNNPIAVKTFISEEDCFKFLEELVKDDSDEPS